MVKKKQARPRQQCPQRARRYTADQKAAALALTLRSAAAVLVLIARPLLASADVPPSFGKPTATDDTTAQQIALATARTWLTAVAKKDKKALTGLYPDDGYKGVTYVQQGVAAIDPKAAKKCKKLFKSTTYKAYAAAQKCLLEKDFVTAAAQATDPNADSNVNGEFIYLENWSDIPKDSPVFILAADFLTTLDESAAFVLVKNLTGGTKRYQVLLAVAEEQVGYMEDGAVMAVFASGEDLAARTWAQPTEVEALAAANRWLEGMSDGDILIINELLRPAAGFVYTQHVPVPDKKLKKCNKATTIKKPKDFAPLAACLFADDVRLGFAISPYVSVTPREDITLRTAAKTLDALDKDHTFVTAVFSATMATTPALAELVLAITTHPDHGARISAVFGVPAP